VIFDDGFGILDGNVEFLLCYFKRFWLLLLCWICCVVVGWKWKIWCFRD